MVHQNGDLGMEVCINTLEGLLHRYPRYDHRFGIHHFGFSQVDQVKRAAAMGAVISSNPFYVHVLGEQYSKVGVGPERSEVMARGRTVVDSGAPLSFHSDAPMAPARPMLLAWSAVNRIGLSGKTVLGPQEKVTV
ncbi:MAG: amidohydrolase family protein, partial [Chromatiales bacterium]|nr:amidohydrolase family protein [Chromatiales bacterium]